MNSEALVEDLKEDIVFSLGYFGPLPSPRLRKVCVSKMYYSPKAEWNAMIAFVRAVAMLEDEGKIRRDGNVWRKSWTKKLIWWTCSSLFVRHRLGKPQ